MNTYLKEDIGKSDWSHLVKLKIAHGHQHTFPPIILHFRENMTFIYTSIHTQENLMNKTEIYPNVYLQNG